MAGFEVTDMLGVPPVACPCGKARRAFADFGGGLATLHVTDISDEARVHFHRKITEIYLFLEGEGIMELDGKEVPVTPMRAVFIKPGCRHRAVGRFRVAITAIPAFDPEDEWFD